MMKKIFTLILLTAAALSFAKPVLIQYSTYLTDAQRQARTDITGKSIYFRLYDAETGGNKLWEEMQDVTANNGFVSVILGSSEELPVRAIDTASALWLEMEISGEDAFARQRIYAGFYSLSAGIADTAIFAQTAAVAMQSQSANKADSLGSRPAADYALVTDIPTISGNADTANIAKDADSLGGITSFAYALKTDTISNAIKSRKADSLGNKSAAEYALVTDIPLISGNADTANIAKNADSLGGVVASRYVRTGTNGYIGIGGLDSAESEIHVYDSTSVPGIRLSSGRVGGSDGHVEYKNSEKLYPSTRMVVGHWANDSGEFQIQTGTGNFEPTVKFKVHSNGNVGIGVDNPIEELHLKNNQAAGTNILIENTNDQSGAGAGILLKAHSSKTGGINFYNGSDERKGAIAYGHSAHSYNDGMVFITNDTVRSKITNEGTFFSSGFHSSNLETDVRGSYASGVTQITNNNSDVFTLKNAIGCVLIFGRHDNYDEYWALVSYKADGNSGDFCRVLLSDGGTWGNYTMQLHGQTGTPGQINVGAAFIAGMPRFYLENQSGATISLSFTILGS